MIARLTTAAVGIPLLVLVVWAGEPWFAMAVAGLAAIGAVEVCRMARNRGMTPSQTSAAVLTLALVGSHYVYSTDVSTPGFTLQGLIAALVVVAASFYSVKSFGPMKPRSWGLTIGAALYPGGLLAHAPLLRDLDQGLEWVVFLLIVTFSTDTAAFFVGKAIGKRPLAPKISPNKTWEGAIGGFLGAIVAATLAAMALDLDSGMATILILGALMGVVGQVGDLFESRLKRIANVKDSGGLFPGHGGVLDRLDSIVFNLVLVYYFVIWGVQ